MEQQHCTYSMNEVELSLGIYNCRLFWNWQSCGTARRAFQNQHDSCKAPPAREHRPLVAC